MEQRYTMHLIINTHWDREYRWSFSETRLRLLEAMDLLLETMEKDSRFIAFHTDSQTSMVDDYLELRPGKKETIKKLIREGRLQIGPWYTLPAQFLVSGEALTRNLLMGHRIAHSLGGVMKVGYNIFSWGQISQLPQIYRQFDMDTILFYRGIDQSALDHLEFRWIAPNGDSTLGITFGAYHRLNFWVYVYKPYIFGIRPGTNPEGFRRTGEDGTMTHLCDPYSDDINHHILNQPCHADLEAALEGMEELLNTLKDKSSTSQLLFLQGFDQEVPDPVVPDLVEEINENIDYGRIVISTLPGYVRAVKKELKEKGLYDHLQTLTGEMLSVEKQGDPFGPLYPGVFSARMPVKLRNYDCQVRLERWAEPASVWAYMVGEEYPLMPLQAAWKELLQNQQHDGIGGCHVDRVTTAMYERYANVRDVAETLTRNALHSLVNKTDFSELAEHDIGILIFNPHPIELDRIVEATLDVPVVFDPGIHGKYSKESAIVIRDSRGERIECQVLSVEKETVYAYLKFGSHTFFDTRRYRVALAAKKIPPTGFVKMSTRAVGNREDSGAFLSPSHRLLENEFLKVKIHGDGTLTLEDKTNGSTFKGLHYFEDQGEQGGPLAFIPLANDGPLTTRGHPADIMLMHNGPLLTTYRITHEWLLPEALMSMIKIHVPHGMEWIDHGNPYRSENKKVLKIITDVTLRKGSRILEFHTSVENTVKDHRLRVVFPTRLNARYVWADIPYDVVRREIRRPEAKGWYEKPLRTFPSTSFVDVSNEKTGLSLFHYGIPEYEVSDDPLQAIHLTLLRAFRTAGNPSETHVPQTLTQCPGGQEYRYALYPHAGTWENGELIREVHVFTTPLRVAQCSAHKGEIKENSFSFFRLSPDDLIMTALKKAEREEAIVLRFFNPADRILKTELHSHFKIRKAVRVTLEEKTMHTLALQANDHQVRMEVKPKEIVSIMLFYRNA